jgi:glyoxalase family protein
MTLSLMQGNRLSRNNSIALVQANVRGFRGSQVYLRTTTGRRSPLQGDTIMARNGIHHVTAISGPARPNVHFYTRTLGLRLVKKTVNFDDPGTYHLYYGDEAGQPGTILTFFPWEHVAPGRLGVGETQETVFRVPEGSIGYWAHRFVAKGVAHKAIEKRFGETVLSLEDADGMRLALIGVPGIEGEPAWSGGEVPAEHAIRGFPQRQLALARGGPDRCDPHGRVRLL